MRLFPNWLRRVRHVRTIRQMTRAALACFCMGVIAPAEQGHMMFARPCELFIEGRVVTRNNCRGSHVHFTGSLLANAELRSAQSHGHSRRSCVEDIASGGVWRYFSLLFRGGRCGPRGGQNQHVRASMCVRQCVCVCVRPRNPLMQRTLLRVFVSGDQLSGLRWHVTLVRAIRAATQAHIAAPRAEAWLRYRGTAELRDSVS